MGWINQTSEICIIYGLDESDYRQESVLSMGWINQIIST